MAKLTGQTIANSYDQLLIVGDADGITSTAQKVESADTGGNASLLYLSTTEVYSPGKAVDGSNNTVFGKGAGAALDDGGLGNTILGKSAGAAITTGDNNVIIGKDALKTGDVAEEANVVIGKGAMELLNCLTNGSDNIAIGQGALKGGAATTVTGCIAIGDAALDNTDSNDHTGTIAIGLNALSNCSSGSSNTVVGSNGAAALATGGNNTVMGFNALASADGAEADNTAIGTSCMGALNEDSSLKNTAVGSLALDGAVDVDNTVAIGYQSLSGVLTGVENIAVGSSAGAALTGGAKNVVIGFAALDAATTALNNVVIGHQAMSTVPASLALDGCVAIGTNAFLGASGTTTGADGTVAIGTNALKVLESGAGNMAIGLNAAPLTTSGTGNTIIGHTAALAMLAASGYNTALGSGSFGGAHTGADSDHCTALGYSALSAALNGASHNVAVGSQSLDAVTTGSRNTAIGRDSGGTLTTGTYNTYVGSNADCDAVSDSYQTRIGHYGALRYMTAQLNMSGDEQGSFTNAGTDNRPATGALLKIPQFGFLKRVTCTVVTASGGTGIYNISLGNTSVAAGTVLDTQLELIGAGAADGNGTYSRTQAADIAGDANLDIVTAKYVHIWEANLVTDASAGWADVDKFLYVCHAGTGNAENAQDAVLRITAEYFGEV